MRAEDIPEAVCWHEGMPLSPHHFQQLSLRNETLAAYLARAGHPLGWGVINLSLDESALCAGMVRVLALDAVMPDGLFVHHMPSIGALELDVTKMSEGQPADGRPITVSIAVPNPTSATSPESSSARYRSAMGASVVDLTTGDNAMALPVWRPALRLVVNDEGGDLVRLPVVRLSALGGGFTVESYTPPTPVVLPESTIGRRLMQVCRHLRDKCLFLSARLKNAERAGDQESELELRRLLSVLWLRLPELEVLLQTGCAHPASLYVATSGLAGALASLDPVAGVPAWAPFNFLELERCFSEMERWLMTALLTLREDFRMVRFDHDQRGFLLPAETLSNQDDFIIAVRVPSAVDEADVAAWLAQAVIAADGKVPELVRQRATGLVRHALAREEMARYAMSNGTLLYRVVCAESWLKLGEALRIAPPEVGIGHAPWEILLMVPLQVASESSRTPQTTA